MRFVSFGGCFRGDSVKNQMFSDVYEPGPNKKRQSRCTPQQGVPKLPPSLYVLQLQNMQYICKCDRFVKTLHLEPWPSLSYICRSHYHLFTNVLLMLEPHIVDGINLCLLLTCCHLRSLSGSVSVTFSPPHRGLWAWLACSKM